MNKAASASERRWVSFQNGKTPHSEIKQPQIGLKPPCHRWKHPTRLTHTPSVIFTYWRWGGTDTRKTAFQKSIVDRAGRGAICLFGKVEKNLRVHCAHGKRWASWCSNPSRKRQRERCVRWHVIVWTQSDQPPRKNTAIFVRSCCLVAGLSANTDIQSFVIKSLSLAGICLSLLLLLQLLPKK